MVAGVLFVLGHEKMMLANPEALPNQNHANPEEKVDRHIARMPDRLAEGVGHLQVDDQFFTRCWTHQEFRRMGFFDA